METVLEAIIAEHDVILVDSSMNTNDKGFASKIYETQYTCEINNKDVQEVIVNCQDFPELFLEKNVYTIKQMAYEIGKFHQIIADKRKHLQNLVDSKHNKKNKFHKTHNEQAEKLLHELNEASYINKRIAEKNSIEIPQDNLYHALFTGIKNISKVVGLKQNYEDTHKTFTRKKPKRINYNDERLFAYALYRAIEFDESVGIITKDSDFDRFAYIGIPTLFSDEFTHHHGTIRKAVINKVRVYHQHQNNAWSGVHPQKEFKKQCYCSKIGYRNNQSLHARLEWVWKDYSQKERENHEKELASGSEHNNL